MASHGCSLEPHPTSQPPSEFTQDFSGEVSPFILGPIPSSPPDHAPPLPATNIIPPTPCKDDGSQANTATNTIGASLSNSSSLMDLGGYSSATAPHERFPEEHELVTHQEGHSVTGRRSAELNAALDVGFAAVERCFLDLSGSSTLPVSQLINMFLKSCGRIVNGTNYWNLYASYFKEHIKMELARIGREVPAGGGTPSATMRTQCYDKFKEAYPDSYQDLLLMHEEASLLGSSPQTIAQQCTGIPETLPKSHPDCAVFSLELFSNSASIKSGFEAAIVLCGKVVNEDGSLGHSYNTPGAAGFWETRCRASDDAIIGHLKAHVYNGSSLAAVPEGRDDAYKWVKLELIKQVAQLGGKCAWDKNFPWKSMSSALADANLCIRGYPAHKCLLPGEAHNENSRNKGIRALTQKEIMVDKANRGAVMASERPVITGIAPPSDWPHAGARRLFVNGDTDYHGPAPLKPSSAATKVKKAEKAPKASADNDDSDNDHPVPAPKIQKPTMPQPTARSEVIELTSTEENAVEEPDTEYEEARGKKRKLKSVNASRAPKKPAPSEEKTDTSKAGKKGAWTKPPEAPPLPTSTTSPTKGGPLSPLTVGSSSVTASPEPGIKQTKPHPVTKQSKGKMKQYSSQVDEGKRTNVMAAKSAVSPALADVPAEPPQEDLPEVMHKDESGGDQQEPAITNSLEEDSHNAIDTSHNPHNPPHDPPHDLHQAHQELPREASSQPLSREVHHPREDTPVIERDALHPHDAFYHPRYTSLQPRDHYGPNDPCADGEFTMRDSSPASELLRDAHYAHVQYLVPAMLVKGDTLDAMTLMSGGHLMELTVIVGISKVRGTSEALNYISSDNNHDDMPEALQGPLGNQNQPSDEAYEGTLTVGCTKKCCQGMQSCPHIAGKVEIMANHLLCCQYVPGNVKTNAETFKRGNQELVMNADTDTLLTDESEPDNNTENVPESNGTPSSSFSAVALQLQQDADDDDNEEYISGLGQVVEVEDDISGISESSRRRQIHCFFGQKTMFRIRDMFNWSVEGVKNMESEALFYELMSRLPEDESTSRNVPWESSGTGNGPSSSIVIDDSE
ncbi:hypothetical protein F4604DRAFT_1905288 [Suillus subluteus]|nr:hypothetical protein F4604DRAFT_1905288 [Suillus subluteus]